MVLCDYFHFSRQLAAFGSHAREQSNPSGRHRHASIDINLNTLHKTKPFFSPSPSNLPTTHESHNQFPFNSAIWFYCAEPRTPIICITQKSYRNLIEFNFAVVAWRYLLHSSGVSRWAPKRCCRIVDVDGVTDVLEVTLVIMIVRDTFDFPAFTECHPFHHIEHKNQSAAESSMAALRLQYTISYACRTAM